MTCLVGLTIFQACPVCACLSTTHNVENILWPSSIAYITHESLQSTQMTSLVSKKGMIFSLLYLQISCYLRTQICSCATISVSNVILYRKVEHVVVLMVDPIHSMHKRRTGSCSRLCEVNCMSGSEELYEKRQFSPWQI